ncbi:helix-turn-helix domain-containing protein [Dinghuibacter silviterrae]|uniref:AraC family transcriptional regulator n=1 Tax=Dinghuibacter silviterrae TaxID=1539049 RepID=A0A4R8DY40_9BACT|nr:helix-turn-helix domain-containing protein [Dinghuibacter silviterrae]TDX02367.1 AraC family transcriptional regulator [Dinghuibacter silviterrae]
MQLFAPTPVLRPYIRSFLVLDTASAMDNRVVPDTSIVVAFRYAGEVNTAEEGTLPRLVISGLRKTARVLHYEQGTGNILAILREGAARSFFPIAFHELFGQSINLDTFVPASLLQAVEERLNEATDAVSRVAVVASFLTDRLNDTREDRLITSVVHKIRADKGELPIGALLRDIPLSRDPFEKRFRQAVGATPKQFSSIVRFRNLITTYPKAGSLTRMAYASGFFDQAHFIKDFRAFTGKAPREFFAGADYW